jgi:hypothetical protein
MRKILLLAVLVLVAVPAAFAEDSPSPATPNTLCKQQRVAIGMAAFKLLYGSNNAYGKCVSKAATAATANTTNAAKLCAAERASATFADEHGGKTFAQFYGTGPHGNNAFGKCVSSKAQTLQQEQQQATINAAKTCKAERTAMGAGPFTAKYGGHANAFGKCVSKTAKANP